MTRPVFVFHSDYEADIGAHVFPTEKYRRTRERLLAEGDTTASDWLTSPLALREELETVHTPAYLEDFLNARMTERTAFSELPITPGIVRAYVLSAGGTILACREALARGFAVNVGGGHHHAFADHAEGFCYLNDIAIGIRILQRERKIERAAVIDLDLHQGNGTAHIFLGDDSVYTFSMHQENLYPVKQPSDWDIGLDNGTGDGPYLGHLSEALPRIFERARPDFVVYQAGADPYVKDQLGHLEITLAGLRERDRLVLEECARQGVPCAVTFGGGYARDVEDTIAIHVNTCREALAAAGVAPAA
ncbi:MAG: histone deacetylase family protein [Candidatus Eiseniibacteriota bacterium]